MRFMHSGRAGTICQAGHAPIGQRQPRADITAGRSAVARHDFTRRRSAAASYFTTLPRCYLSPYRAMRQGLPRYVMLTWPTFHAHIITFAEEHGRAFPFTIVQISAAGFTRI